MTDATRKYLDEVRARYEKATVGPWTSHEPGSIGAGAGWVTGDGWNVARCEARTDGSCLRDAEFIAHAREDIPRLLALVDELTRVDEKP